ncbi:NAD(P)-dependent oxidoreductase [Mycobacterium sp. DL440]|uniref:NAD(P)-dependent oxidoreductase n=1 Tax=Mycobacterium sp. DL440 TaxID=2675523 RepID=UPI0014239A75|nr:NAD(P)-binding domain-containing protein [Mycobacterium sp. DL440]
MAETIGFIGAGQMGEPMVVRLLAAGHDVVLFARRDDVRDRLAKAGAAVTDSIPHVAAKSDILFGCFFSDSQLTDAASGSDGFISSAKPGSIFVSHTTGNLSTLKSIAAESPSPPTILDAPISGSADDILAGKLTVLIGGPAGAVEQVTPVIRAYAENIIAAGDLGSALNLKLINNALFAANAQLVAVATDIGRQLDVAPAALLAALAVSSGGSRAASYVQAAGGVDQFATLVAPFLRKDMAAAKLQADEVGADLALLAAVVQDGPLELTSQTAAAH